MISIRRDGWIVAHFRFCFGGKTKEADSAQRVSIAPIRLGQADQGLLLSLLECIFYCVFFYPMILDIEKPRVLCSPKNIT